MGRLGEKSSVLCLSGYLLKVNFMFDLYSSKNAEPLAVVMGHDKNMIEFKFLCRTTTKGR